MSIPVSCGQCGWKATVKDELAGRKGKCPTCGKPIAVAHPRAAPDVESAAAAALAEDDDVPAPPPSAYVQAEAPRVVDRAAAPRTAERPRRGPATRIKSRAKDQAPGPRGLNLNETAIGGLLMMGGAALWFAIGYFLIDRIYIYPPFLFVIGLIVFVRGLATRNEAP